MKINTLLSALRMLPEWDRVTMVCVMPTSPATVQREDVVKLCQEVGYIKTEGE